MLNKCGNSIIENTICWREKALKYFTTRQPATFNSLVSPISIVGPAPKTPG